MNRKIEYLEQSFDVIKDQWPSRKKAIQKCIISSFNISPDKSLEMWEYILTKNKKDLKSDSKSLVGEILDGFMSQYDGFKYGRDKLFIRLNLFKDVLLKRPSLQELLFQYSNDFGCDGNYDTHLAAEAVKGTFALILEDGETEIVDSIIQYLSKNKLVKEFTVGKFLLDVSEFISNTNSSIIDEANFLIPRYAKESLVKSVESIKNSEDRAEALIAVMDIV